MSFEEFIKYLNNSSKKVLFKNYPFTIADIFKSATALKNKIVNKPPEELWAKVIKNASALISNIIIPILDFYKNKYPKAIVKVNIESFYRSPVLNSKIGGANTSQHTTGKYEGGEAIDFNIYVDNKVLSQKEVFNDIISGRILHKGLKQPIKNLIDQCIYEGTWIHCSHSRLQRRKQFLIYENKKYTVTTKEI